MKHRLKLKVLCLTILKILCLTGFLWQGVKFLQLYFNYPTSVQIGIGREDTLEFPAITICHTNRLRKSFVEDRWPEVFWENSTVGKKRSLAFDLMQFLPNYYINLTLEEQIQAGHQIQNLVPSCSCGRNSMSCKTWYPSPFYSPNVFQYGMCYTLILQEKALKQDWLKCLAIVNLEPNEVLSENVQAKLVIHHKNYVPEFTTTDGVLLEPGKDYDLKIQQSTTQMLPAPYGQECHDDNQLGMDEEVCVGACTHKKLIDKCNCFLIDPMSEGVPTNRSSARPCGLGKNKPHIELYNCMKTLGVREIKKACKRKCVPPCKMISYHVTMLSADWPMNNRSKKTRFKSESIKERWTETARWSIGLSTLEEERRNLARIYIHFSTKIHVIYTQYPKFEEIELFSYVGGYLGMWLGASLFTCLDIIGNFIQKVNKKKAVLGQDNPEGHKSAKASSITLRSVEN
ncbi:epithelial sodium channel subunit alpha-like isoform X2 [Tachypleus tridentatus]|uniref:epithelial sodium channel subunit alpha-like isoform X2 n=1 Tax=Tachypleus tridentatus TaxID=6853 RepID=UPI003FD37262